MTGDDTEDSGFGPEPSPAQEPPEQPKSSAGGAGGTAENVDVDEDEDEDEDENDNQSADEDNDNPFAELDAEANGRPLLKTLFGKMNARTAAAWLKNAANRAMDAGWSYGEIRQALVLLGVGEIKLPRVLEKPQVVPPPACEGLPTGYFRKAPFGDVFRRSADEMTGQPTDVRICNHLNVLRQTTDSDGGVSSILVELVNMHGEVRRVSVKASVARTDSRVAISELIDNGLIIYGYGDKAHLEILRMILEAAASRPPMRYLSQTGYCTFAGVKAFALPSQIIGATVADDISWDGDVRMCRAGAAGTLADWLVVIAPCDGNMTPMLAIGIMLASPAIPYLPGGTEANSGIHVLGKTSRGKTTSSKLGATVWGPGLDTRDPNSFLESFRSTGNANESPLAGHRHVGAVFDEIQLFDAKAALAWAYEVSSGRGKRRMNADGSLRKTRTWELFLFTNGEKSLQDIANEGQPRKRVMSGGAEARIINLRIDNAFPNTHGEDPEAFVERLAAEAGRVYGTAGPAFVERIFAHENYAREYLARLWEVVWKHISLGVLPPGASPQAKRVASRLGTMAIAATFAAHLLDLPWGTTGAVVEAALGGETVKDGERAMLWAFAEALKLWIATHEGGLASSDTAARIAELVAYYHAHVTLFDTIAYEKKHDKLGSHLDPRPHEPQTRAGFRIVDRRDQKNEQLLYVEVLTETLTRALGWSATDIDFTMTDLRDRGLLVATGGRLQRRRRIGADRPWVYRVKGSVFSQ
jgi:hypothetical protein